MDNNNQPEDKSTQSVESFDTEAETPNTQGQPAPAPKPVSPQPAVPQPAQPVPSQPSAPTPVVTPAPVAKPATAPAPQMQAQKPAAMPQGQPQTRSMQPQVKPPVRQLTKDEMIQREKGRNKKVLMGCGGAFGCGTILLLVLIFVFVGTAGTGSSALAEALGVNQQELINSLILIVNLFFGLSALIAFILSIGGIFKAMMARKDDTFAKRNGYIMSGSAFGVLILIIFLWIGAWYYLTSQQSPIDNKPQGLITIPATTINLTAPVEIVFDASNLPYDKNQFEILTYNWNFGDGSSGPGTNKETHIYKSKGDGRYDVVLMLTFRNKRTGEESQQSVERTVTIADEKVSAIIVVDSTSGPVPFTVIFDGSQSADPDGEISTYSWEVDGQGFEEGSATFEYTFEQVGDHSVKLRVTNSKGDFAIAEESINVSKGTIPVADIKVLNSDGSVYFVDKNYTFDASGSTSPLGDIKGYEWDFGDGSPKAKTRTAQHSFNTGGIYKVLLTVTDKDNKTASTEITVSVEVAPTAPKAVMVTNPAKADPKDNFIEGTIPFEVNFDGTSSTDPDDDIVDYKWDFDGDGEYDSAGETTSYTYENAGNFTATLVVMDSAGNENKAVVLVKAMTKGLEAVVIATPVSGVVPLTVEFDATGSNYSDGQIVSYSWDFGDGSPKRSDIGQVTYKYTQIGNFTAKVTVRTNDNKEEESDVLISVRQVPLKSCFVPSKTTGDAPLTLTLDPACATGTIAKYRWDFGDGETSVDRKPSHTFENAGTFEVVLEVSDAQNVVDVFSQFITVTGELTQ